MRSTSRRFLIFIFYTNRLISYAWALGARMPTSYSSRFLLEGGGLMSYGPDFPAIFRRAADFADRILRGMKPADMPVEQPTKWELVIDLKTARVLGLTLSPILLATAPPPKAAGGVLYAAAAS